MFTQRETTALAGSPKGEVRMPDRTRTPNLTLRRLREEERQETRAEFADAMMRIAIELGESVTPTERYIARLENGEIRHPHPAYRRVLTTLCGRSIAALGFRSGETAEPNTIIDLRRETSVREAEDHSTRQDFTLNDVEHMRQSLQEIIGGSPMSDATIDDWERTAIQHARATRYQSSGLLIATLVSDLGDLKQEMLRCHSASSLRRLTRVTAQMAGLVCLTLVKMDERIASRKWARIARIAASEAGDPITLAWVRAQEAYGHYYSGDLHEAIDVARHAQSIIPDLPCVGAALAAALEARALACLNRRTETQSALRRAETILAELDNESRGASAFAYSEAQLRFHEGSAYTHLRDTESAWKAQSRALKLTPDNDYTDRTLARLDRAMCLAHDGDGLAAISFAGQTLNELTAGQRQGIITLRAQEMLDALPHRQQLLPPVLEFKDLLVLLAEDTKGSK